MKQRIMLATWIELLIQTRERMRANKGYAVPVRPILSRQRAVVRMISTTRMMRDS